MLAGSNRPVRNKPVHQAIHMIKRWLRKAVGDAQHREAVVDRLTISSPESLD